MTAYRPSPDHVKQPGFYPVAGEVRTQRYWDGQQWRGDPHPIHPQVDVWLLIRGVAVGVLAAGMVFAVLAATGFFG